MILSLLALAAAHSGPAVATATPSQDEQILQRFLTALLMKDESTLRSIVEPEVLLDPSLDATAAGDTDLNHVLEATRECDVGAILRNYSARPGYVVNWWCDYANDGDWTFPTEGYAVSVSVAGNRIRLRSFNGSTYRPPLISR